MKREMVNHPKHYMDPATGIECSEVTDYMMFNPGNAVKYLWRAGRKDDIEQDLRKAIVYIKRAEENEELHVLPTEPMKKLLEVAMHRENNIQNAFLAISQNEWNTAVQSIELFIESLNSIN